MRGATRAPMTCSPSPHGRRRGSRQPPLSTGPSSSSKLSRDSHLGACRDLSDTITLHMEAGSTTALASGDMLIASTTARSDHVSVGSLAPVKFTATGRTTVRIGGIYQANALIGNYLVSNNYFGTHFLNEQPAAVLLRTDGESGADGRVKAALSACPSSCSARRIGRYHDRINGPSHSRNWPSPSTRRAMLKALIGPAQRWLADAFDERRQLLFGRDTVTASVGLKGIAKWRILQVRSGADGVRRRPCCWRWRW